MPARKVDLFRRTNILTRLFFTVEEARLRHEKFDGGMTKPMTRLCLHRRHGVAVILHETDSNSLIFTEQFRYPTYENGPGWLIELPAGIIDPGDDPLETVCRETEEETGYKVEASRFRHIYTFYLSPGGSSERIYLYYVTVTTQDKKAEGGGLEEEDENVRVLKMPIDEARAKLDAGEFMDSKTLVGLQWFFAQQK
jgi:ADP-ribose pyrophosphatase